MTLFVIIMVKKWRCQCSLIYGSYEDNTYYLSLHDLCAFPEQQASWIVNTFPFGHVAEQDEKFTH